METMLPIAALIVFFVIVASLMEWKSNKDKELYSCYLKMFHKGFASGSGCCGMTDALDPEYSKCKHCYYHKLYLKRKENK